jgi:hypothetical protein
MEEEKYIKLPNLHNFLSDKLLLPDKRKQPTNGKRRRKLSCFLIFPPHNRKENMLLKQKNQQTDRIRSKANKFKNFLNCVFQLFFRFC